MIRLTVPSIEEDDLRAVRQTLISGRLVQGEQVAYFEKKLADIVGVRHAVAVSNCTAALHVSLLALGIGRGDKVAVTAYSWIATANVIELCGAEPVFVDIEPDTFNMDPVRLREVLQLQKAGGKIKAVLAADIFGQIADFQQIESIADDYGLSVIEDAACSLGASLKGKAAGAWGNAGCFSFHPRKAVTTGEGGVVTTNDASLARTVRALRNHGLDPDAKEPDFIMPGFNYRMTEFQAALGQTQLAKLDRILAVRRQLASRYDRLLEGTPVVKPVPKRGRETHVYQSYVVLLPGKPASERAELIRGLKEAGVETTIGTWHMPMTSHFRNRYGFQRGNFPVSDDVFARAMTLPLFETMTPAEQEEVAGKLRSLLERGTAG
jgi:dTDP-4-amino-4,6-dideoxygalactose transaminase